MTGVLVRDVPDDVVAALDARAAPMGLSRSDYLRRRLAQEATTAVERVSVEHLSAFAEPASPPRPTGRSRAARR